MGRIFRIIVLLTLAYGSVLAQCPDLPANTAINSNNTDSEFNFCGPQNVSFSVSDPNLPEGTIDWYSGAIPGFDPLSSGSLLGSSTVSNSGGSCVQCPEIEAMVLNACGDNSVEDDEEFVVISSGSGFFINELSFIFNSTGGSAGNNNIVPGTICEWEPGNSSLFTGCSTLVEPQNTDFIPANSLVILQMSTLAGFTYDISDMCGVSDCVYVLSNTCDRDFAAFKNFEAGNSSTRTFSLNLDCGCAFPLTYTVDDPNFGVVMQDGAYVEGDGITFGNNGCNNGPTITGLNMFNATSTTTDFIYNITDAECNTTQYIRGVLNSPGYNGDCCAAPIQQTNEYEFNISCPTAEMTQDDDGELCVGDCETFTFNFTGGEPTYDIDLTLTTSLLPISGTFPGLPVGQKLTICYGTGDPIIDLANFTINVPAGVPFDGTLTLDGFEDTNGCAGTVLGSTLNLSFNNLFNAVVPPLQTTCDVGSGTGFFVLSDIANIVNGGSGEPVVFYSDPAGTNVLTDPYESDGTDIYAQVMASPCNSEIILIELEVIENGDAGTMSLFCDADGNTECTICDDDQTTGEMVTISIFFADPLLTYNYSIRWTAESGPSSVETGTSVDAVGTFVFNVFETTTFELISVTVDGDCPDETSLGNIVTVYYGLLPIIENPGMLSDCGPVTLPPIVGDEIANAAYFSEPNGQGTQYEPGDIISTTQTVYIYAGIENCDLEIPVLVSIDDAATLDPIDDVNTCGQYVLPAISGNNVDNANYYTETNGGGSLLPVGQIITADITLFVFDPNCGGNEVSFDITISPGPAFTNNLDTMVCGLFVVESITGVDLTGNEAYFTMAGGSGVSIPVGDTISTDSIIYIYDGSPGCVIDAPMNISIGYPQFPGRDTLITICEGDITLYNLMNLLGGSSPDTTGVWSESNSSIISDSSAVDFSSLAIGLFNYHYSISDTICGDTMSTLMVNIVGSVDAGSDELLALCADTTGVNIFDIIGNPDQSGTFYDESGIPTTFDPTNVDFILDTAGIEVFRYVIGDESSSCGSDTSFFTVVKGVDINAGEDNSLTVCTGEQIVLTSLLTDNSDVGYFTEPTPSGGLVPVNIFNSNNVVDGTYEVYHILEGSGPCPNDTAFLELTVTDGPNAGDDNSISLCGDTSFDLSVLIDGDSDPNGNYFLTGIELPTSIVNFTTENGIIEYLYIVGNGITCPLDTAILSINRINIPDNSIMIDNDIICEDECVNVSISAASSGGQSINVFYHIVGSNGNEFNNNAIFVDLTPFNLELCEGSGGLSNGELLAGQSYEIVLDSIVVIGEPCTYLLNTSVSVQVNENATSTQDGTLCGDASIVVGSDVYDKDTPMGITTIPNGSVNGCDSIVTVDLNFEETVNGEYIRILCEGESEEVLGITYTMNFVGDTLLELGSLNGCDSLLTIDLSFLPGEITAESPTICRGDTVLIQGQQFFEGNLTDQIIVPGGSANGCDLTVNVEVSLDDTSMGSFEEAVCNDFSIQINGTTYDQNNPTGVETLMNASQNGCDSILMIALDYSAGAGIDSSFAFSTCDNNYFLQVGSTTFNRTNPMGMVRIPSTTGGCDTTLTVDLTYGEMEVDFEVMDAGCMVIDSGSVTINDINGVAPYSLIYNGNNTIAFVLPVSISLPVGSGEIMITDAGNPACMSTITYDIAEGTDESDFSIVRSGDQLIINGGINADSIQWTPSDGLDCTDCTDPNVIVESTTTFTATIFFGGECELMLEYLFEFDDGIPNYNLPNIFSPNGDNQNDNFTLFIKDGVTGIPQSMRIYDRWGNLVYESTTATDIVSTGWDGSHNGSDVRPGVYVYQIIVIENEQTLNLLGDLTVTR